MAKKRNPIATVLAEPYFRPKTIPNKTREYRKPAQIKNDWPDDYM
jgi:hypothetical protein